MPHGHRRMEALMVLAFASMGTLGRRRDSVDLTARGRQLFRQFAIATIASPERLVTRHGRQARLQ